MYISDGDDDEGGKQEVSIVYWTHFTFHNNPFNITLCWGYLW